MPEQDPPPAWRSVALWPAALAVLVFANTLRNGFVYDDPIVLEWLKTRSWDLEGFLLNTRGVTYAVHALDELLWGDSPAGFHLTNVLLHALTSGLVAVCASSLGATRAAAIATGLFFAVHPVHAEVVASIANRKDMLATVFSLLGLLAWIRVASYPLRIGLTAVCYGLGLYSKEVAAAGLVPMLVLYDVLLRPGPTRAPDGSRGESSRESAGRRLRRSIWDLSPLLVVTLLGAAVFARDIERYFGAESIRKMSDGYYSTYSESTATSLGNLVDVLRLLAFPLHLSIDYPIRPQDGLFAPRALAGLAIAVGWVVVLLKTARRSRPATFALAWVPLTYLPCSNLVPLHHIQVAERYLYLPSFGWCLALGLATGAMLQRSSARPLALAAAGLLLGLGAVRSYARNPDWRDVAALIAAADRDGVDTWRVHKTGATWAMQQERHDEAARRYARAAELRPGDPDLQFWRAVTAARVGDMESALSAGRTAVALRPENTMAHYNLGLALIQTGALAGGIEHLARATELEPDYAPALYNLGVARSLAGDAAGAYVAFQQCVAVSPNYAEAHFNLGALQVTREEWDAALGSLRRAVALEPTSERFVEYLLSVSLSMDRPFAAIEAAEGLSRLQPERAELLEQLGDLRAGVGETHEAIAAWRQAIGAEPRNTRVLAKIGRGAEELGKLDWAIDAYVRWTEIEPGNETARDALERVRGRRE